VDGLSFHPSDGVGRFDGDLEPSCDVSVAADDDTGWLVSFVDLLTLLVTLFVLLLAFTRLSPAPRPQAAAHSAAPPAHAGHRDRKPTPVPVLAPPPASSPLVQAATATPAPPPGAGHRLASQTTAPAREHAHGLRRNGPVQPSRPARPPAGQTRPTAPVLAVPPQIRDQVQAVASGNNVNLVLKNDVVFNTGSATLTPAGRHVLGELATMLRRFDYPISVRGYTDDTPIHTRRFPSNWELSAARAIDVTRYLIAQGVDKSRLRAVGFGDTHPVADNATAAGRARNRRVSLLVHMRPHRAPAQGPHADGASPAP